MHMVSSLAVTLIQAVHLPYTQLFAFLELSIPFWLVLLQNTVEVAVSC
jgi:hypothetical protein